MAATKTEATRTVPTTKISTTVLKTEAILKTSMTTTSAVMTTMTYNDNSLSTTLNADTTTKAETLTVNTITTELARDSDANKTHNTNTASDGSSGGITSYGNIQTSSQNFHDTTTAKTVTVNTITTRLSKDFVSNHTTHIATTTRGSSESGITSHGSDTSNLTTAKSDVSETAAHTTPVSEVNVSETKAHTTPGSGVNYRTVNRSTIKHDGDDTTIVTTAAGDSNSTKAASKQRKRGNTANIELPLINACSGVIDASVSSSNGSFTYIFTSKLYFVLFYIFKKFF